eukprot:GHVU01206942.1.p3 GENE.GHVU01206942.1~~GHVU01206942.1.p3  ORF type:complete len:135 (-),score=16.65 GHVU01206942.1:882-1286(-)
MWEDGDEGEEWAGGATELGGQSPPPLPSRTRTRSSPESNPFTLLSVPHRHPSCGPHPRLRYTSAVHRASRYPRPLAPRFHNTAPTGATGSPAPLSILTTHLLSSPLRCFVSSSSSIYCSCCSSSSSSSSSSTTL